MRVSAQVAVITVVGAVGYYAWNHWSDFRPYMPGFLVGPQQASVPAPGSAPVGGPPGQARPPGQGGLGQGGPGAGGPPNIVEVAPAQVTRIVERAESVGTLRALESVTITSRVSGIVESIGFDEGQTVQRGHEILRFDTAERRADLEAASAAVLTTEAQRQEIATRLERARALRATGAGTDAQVVDLTGQLRTAESNIVTARARERASLARVEEMVVRAPFAGRLGVRSVSLGALVEPRTSITTLDDISKMRLDFSVPEVLIASLQIGSQAQTRTIAYGDRVFTGVVAVIDTRIDPVTRAARLTALIDNVDGALRPGMFMNVALDVAVRPNAVTVPEEAVVGEGPRQIVFVVRENRVERRIVSIGSRDNARVEILDGVTAGEQVVARGTQRVRHGMTVVARPVSAPPGQRPQAAAPGPTAPISRN